MLYRRDGLGGMVCEEVRREGCYIGGMVCEEIRRDGTN